MLLKNVHYKETLMLLVVLKNKFNKARLEALYFKEDMDISTRKNSLIFGVPLGLTISWLNSRPENFYESYFISEELCSLILISYFMLSSIFVVIGVASIKVRMNTSTQEVFTNPIGFFKTQLQALTSDAVKMVMYFFGALLGGFLLALIA